MLGTNPGPAGIACLGCGLTLGAPPITYDFHTMAALDSAFRHYDRDQAVRVILAAHADGLLEVTQ
jgi:hypothetical protein